MKKRKDGRWSKTKTINGERVFFYSSAPTEKKAIADIENQMIEYKGKLERGKLFSDVADEWEEMHYQKIQYQTSSRYKSLVARIVEYFNGWYINTITNEDILLFYESLSMQDFSTKSIKDHASIVRMIMRYAYIKRYIKSNPSDYVIPPKGKPKKERQPLSKDDITAVQNNIFNDFGKIAYFLLYTGLRKGEALALTYDDIDLKNNLIRVNKSVEYISNKPRIKEPKTESGTRCVPLPDALKFLFQGKHKKDEIVFNQKGNLMRKSYFREHWVRYCKEIGIDASPHQFRHTYATLLHEWNISVKDAQHILGHSDVSTTQNIYTHISQARIEQTTKDINRQINCCQSVVNE